MAIVLRNTFLSKVCLYTLFKRWIFWSDPLVKFNTAHNYMMGSVLRVQAIWQLRKNVASNIEQVLAATPNKAPTIRPPASHLENYPS